MPVCFRCLFPYFFPPTDLLLHASGKPSPFYKPVIISMNTMLSSNKLYSDSNRKVVKVGLKAQALNKDHTTVSFNTSTM